MLTDSQIRQKIVKALKHHPVSGYYFRSKALGQMRILPRFQQQAEAMGFVCKPVMVKGRVIRAWVNCSYVAPNWRDMEKMVEKGELF